MKKIAAYICLVLAVALSAGCESEQLVSDCEAVDVMLRLETLPESMAGDWTKGAPDSVVEGDGVNYQVEDFWLFEYNTNGLLVGKPCYYENVSSGMNVSVFRPSSGIYRCYVIANTHNPGFLSELDGYNTESALRKAHKLVNSCDDLYQDGAGQGAYDLLMSGVMEIGPQTGQVLSCSLRRNVAKLSLTLVNADDSQITLNTIQIKNVSDHLFYADVMYDGSPAPSPTESETGFTNLDVETIDLSGGNSHSVTYYLPRNMRGDCGDASTTSDKNLNAPNTATYLEIMATNDNTGTSLRYRFYLGKDMLDNFDVEPNYHYNLPITFTSKGAEDDSRVEDMGLIHLADANSYILQPLSTAVQTTYTIPVVERINKFWSSDEGRKVGADYASFMIEENTEWVAEIIWQDTPQKVLIFCDASGREFDDGNFSATGQSLLYFRPTQQAYNNPCNVLVGVRRKDRSDYLWSWHIWMTEYNPDQYPGQWNDGQHLYSVDGGYLHRYSGSYWNKNLKDKYIMDRNLGARSALRSAGLMDNAGFGYQFGRKDPFPMVKKYPIYDADGNQITFNGTSKDDPIGKVEGPAWMYQSVFNPVVFFKDPAPHEDWLKNEDLYTYIWNDIDGKTSGKSFFDPCPPGWKLPEYGTWESLTLASLIEDSWSSGPTLGWDLYMGEFGESETVFFPIAGWRNLSDGVIGYNQSARSDNYIFTRVWTSKSLSKSSGSFINLGRGNASTNFTPDVRPTASNYKSYANSARCIQE